MVAQNWRSRNKANAWNTIGAMIPATELSSPNSFATMTSGTMMRGMDPKVRRHDVDEREAHQQHSGHARQPTVLICLVVAARCCVHSSTSLSSLVCGLTSTRS